MYMHLEILNADKYRAKLPYEGRNEMQANILQTKKLITGVERTSNYEGVSSKISASAVVERLTSNPPRERQPRAAPFVREVKAPRAVAKSQRPGSLLTPSNKTNVKSMKALDGAKLEPIGQPRGRNNQSPSAFERKNTEKSPVTKQLKSNLITPQSVTQAPPPKTSTSKVA